MCSPSQGPPGRSLGFPCCLSLWRVWGGPGWPRFGVLKLSRGCAPATTYLLSWAPDICSSRLRWRPPAAWFVNSNLKALVCLRDPICRPFPLAGGGGLALWRDWRHPLGAAQGFRGLCICQFPREEANLSLFERSHGNSLFRESSEPWTLWCPGSAPTCVPVLAPANTPTRGQVALPDWRGFFFMHPSTAGVGGE